MIVPISHSTHSLITDSVESVQVVVMNEDQIAIRSPLRMHVRIMYVVQQKHNDLDSRHSLRRCILIKRVEDPGTFKAEIRTRLRN